MKTKTFLFMWFFISAFYSFGQEIEGVQKLGNEALKKVERSIQRNSNEVLLELKGSSQSGIKSLTISKEAWIKQEETFCKSISKSLIQNDFDNTYSADIKSSYFLHNAESIKQNAIDATPNLTYDFSACDVSVSGTAVSYTVKIINIGSSSAGSSYLGYYVYNESTSSAYWIGNDYVSSLSSGNSSSKNYSVDINTFSDLPNGTYRLGFMIDYKESVSESDEDDNGGLFPSAKVIKGGNSSPNLAFDESNTQLSVSGSTISVSAKLINNGSGSASSSYLAYILMDEAIENAYLLGESYVSSLSAGGSSTKTFSMDINTMSDLPDGNYYVCLWADYLETVEENDEDDNIIVFETPMISKGGESYPNLTFNENATQIAVSGSTVSVSAEVVNNGVENASSSYLGYILVDEAVENVYLMGDDYVSPLSAGASSTETFSKDINSMPDLPAGDYYVCLWADYSEKIEESDEDDNIILFESPMVSKGGDHGIPNLTYNADFTEISVNGTVVSVQARADNIGDGDAGSFRLEYILVKEENDEVTGVYSMGYDDIAGIKAGAYSEQSIEVDVATVSDIPADTYYVGYFVDWDDEIEESDETDNGIYFNNASVTITDNSEPEIDVNPTEITIREDAEKTESSRVAPFQCSYIPRIETLKVTEDTDSKGNSICAVNMDGIPPEKYSVSSMKQAAVESVTSLSGVPAFSWSFGCSATAAAMIAGYYDRHGFDNMYAGPENSGVMPLDNSTWGSTVDVAGDTRDICPLSATMKGVDERTIRGHVDDYWVSSLSDERDPFMANAWNEHAWGDCTADYMYTSQYKAENVDGSTRFYFYPNGEKCIVSGEDGLYDGCYGFAEFIESRGYEVKEYYSQYIKGYDGNTEGFMFDDFVHEIDNGRPVMIHVEKHSMVGVGYDIETKIIYFHNGWDYNVYSMPWAGSYEGLQQYGVSVFELEGSINGNGDGNFTISNIGDGTLLVSEISCDKAWLSTDISSAEIAAESGRQVVVSVDWNLLGTAETGHITVKSNDADEPSVIVTVNAIPEKEETYYTITITANPQDGGTVSGAGDYKEGASVTVKALAADGYEFIDWTENGASVSGNSEYTFSVSADRNLTANFEEESGCSPDWEVVSYTNSTTAYGIVSIEGEPAAQGDLVGAFVNGECRGYGECIVDNGTAYVTLLIQGEAAEYAQFKIWDKSECAEVNAGGHQTQPGGSIGYPPNYLTIDGGSQIQQSLSFNKGWNLNSLYVHPDDMSPESIFASMRYLSQVKSMTESYDPDLQSYLNTLDELNDGEAYFINVKSNESLTVAGQKLNGASINIQLSSGWNLIAYPFQKSLSTETAFATLISSGNLVQLKSMDESYDPKVPPYLNTLTVLEPGEGYLIKVNNSCSFSYPESESALANAAPRNVSYSPWTVVTAPESMVEYLQVSLDGKTIESSAKVGAFINNECRGQSDILTDGYDTYASLVINGEEKAPVEFYLYYEGVIYRSDKTVNLRPGSVNRTVVDVNFNSQYATSLTNNFTDAECSVMPNPVEDELSIHYSLSEKASVEIRITDLMGKTVYVYRNTGVAGKNTINLLDVKNRYNMMQGTYVLRFKSGNRISSQKLLIK